MSCGDIVLCSDNTCIYYQKHYTCSMGNYHLGDRIKNVLKGDKLGYIYDTNPLGSKRSLTVCYDDNKKERLFGMKVCQAIKQTGDPRDITKIHPKFQ